MEKVTIVIPTRDRADVLRYCLQSTLSLTYKNLTVLVSDNSSIDDTAEVVRSFRDERLTYVKTPERVSMASNWEFALSHVSEGWVTVIGDDDAVLPDGVERMLEIAKATGVSAIRSSTCLYLWPGLLDRAFGKLQVPLGKGFRVLQCREMLQAVLDGRIRYPNLPMLYNGGFVRVELISRIRDRCGRFLFSPTPDVYSAMAFCATIDRYAYSLEPLAIDGNSSHSGGIAAFLPKRIAGKLHAEPAEKFMQELDFPFHPSVPLMTDGRFPPSFQAAVFECFQQARQVLPLSSLLFDPASQLQLILAETAHAGKAGVLEDWVPRFIAANGLTSQGQIMPEIWARYRIAKRRLGDMRRALDVAVIEGSSSIPLGNVYEASMMASKLKEAHINRFLNWTRRGLAFVQQKVAAAKIPQADRIR